MDAQDFLLSPEGCTSSLGHRLVDREPERSSGVVVNFWSLVELQPLGVYCDIPRGIVYLWSENFDWLASVGKASLFASASFRS
ncbi:hypothetical protein BHE74_00038518 [Ensete ventricosum]|nr:hypothetical protein BHE74_00038518 [Ensete ventricosum]